MSHNARFSLLTLLLFFIFSGAAFSQQDSPQKPAISYSAGMTGFSDSAFSSAETLRFSINLESERAKPFTPSLFAAIQFDFNPLSLQTAYWGLGFYLTLFNLQNHFFSFASMRKTSWAPAFCAAFYFPFDSAKNSYFETTAEPIRLFTGSSYVSLLSPGALFSKNFKITGYSLSPFKFTYYFY